MRMAQGGTRPNMMMMRRMIRMAMTMMMVMMVMMTMMGNRQGKHSGRAALMMMTMMGNLLEISGQNQRWCFCSLLIALS